MLLELKDELERNLYIDAVVKIYRGRYGISSEDLRKRVNTLALKGLLQAPDSAGKKKKKGVGVRHFPEAYAYLVVTYPKIFDKGGPVSDSGGFCCSPLPGGGSDAVSAERKD